MNKRDKHLWLFHNELFFLSSMLFTHPRSEKEVEIFMEESLIFQIPCAELLQEKMRVLDDLLHFGVILLTGRKSGV